jgi:formamidopyrimidine-DNA glycosylase
MPELPEVETTLRGLAPHLKGQRIRELRVRERRLRYPVADDTEARLAGQGILGLRRRGKYLLLDLERGTLLVHLGMSGSLRMVPAMTPPEPHDHLDLVVGEDICLRLRDPRRFGLFLWTADPPERHPLLRDLGPEPLEDAFDGTYLFARSRGRQAAIKVFIMDAKVVVGVGNIYASESLFLAGIRPDCSAGQLGTTQYDRLATAIRAILREAITAGGTSLRDFVREDGHPGYFARQLRVYGRRGQPCSICGTAIKRESIGQRSSFFCPQCQARRTGDDEDLPLER